MALFSRRKRRGPDELYGTGLWRQHRDRFNRAVDRFYTTAAAVHEEAPGTAPAELLARQTLRLNELGTAVDAATAAAHAAFPSSGMVLPAEARAAVGRLPELLSRSALKVAEAAQAAAMTRAELLTGRDASAAAASASGYVDDAVGIVAECTRSTAAL